jgi:RNA recognition motif-containing protein
VSHRLARIKLAKKQNEREKREQEISARKQLANVRVVQKNLVYVLGLPPKICSEEILRQHEYFGQYGKILKIVINRRPTTNAQGQSIINGGVYITYVKKEDASKAIDAVDGSSCDGKLIRCVFLSSMLYILPLLILLRTSSTHSAHIPFFTKPILFN